MYTEAVNNVRIVGAELVYLVNLLEVQVSMESEHQHVHVVCMVKPVVKVASLDLM